MSRIGNLPIAIPGGVTVEEKSRSVTVNGPKGRLSIDLRPEVDIALSAREIVVRPNGSGSPRAARAYHGMTRALLANMVRGVTRGYSRMLEIVGVGWNAAGRGRELHLNIGFCHPVVFPVPAGLEVETPRPTQIIIRGADKQALGQFAAKVRAIRPPEPYKGKGIRYEGEVVRRKAGKSFGS
jgi:large subunit ribosomal protein L6